MLSPSKRKRKISVHAMIEGNFDSNKKPLTPLGTTKEERIVNTVEFCPENTTMPGISSAYSSTHAAIDLISSMKYPVPADPLVPLGTKNIDAFKMWQTSSKDKSQKMPKLRHLKFRPK